MKKSIRMLLCGTAAALLLSTGVSAAGREVSVEINGQPLTFSEAAPQIVNDRTYLPFRAVFNALGFADENITFQPQQRQVKAVKDGMEISMVIGENRLTVVEKGETRVIDTDVPAFIDANLGRTYVPARFVSEAAGYRVGWNNGTSTVIIDDVETILASDQATYNKLEDLTAYLEKVRDVQPVKLDGKYSMIAMEGEEKMELQGSIQSLSDEKGGMEGALDMAISGRIQGKDLSTMIPEPIRLDLRGDSSTGDFYFRAANLQNVVDRETWYHLKLDLPQEVQQFNQLDLTQLKGKNGRETAHNLVRAMAENNPAVGTWKLLEGFRALLSDQALKQTEGGWQAELALEQYKLTVMVAGNEKNVNGYAVGIEHQENGQTVALEGGVVGDMVEVTFSQKGGSRTTVLVLQGSYAKSDRTPMTTPAAGEKIVEMKESPLPAPAP